MNVEILNGQAEARVTIEVLDNSLVGQIFSLEFESVNAESDYVLQTDLVFIEIIGEEFQPPTFVSSPLGILDDMIISLGDYSSLE